MSPKTGSTTAQMMRGNTHPMPGAGGREFVFDPTGGTAYLTTDEAAAILRVNVDTLCKMIRSKKLRASFIGRAWLTSHSAINEFVESQAQGGPQQS